MKLFVKIFAFLSNKNQNRATLKGIILYTDSALFQSMRVEDGEKSKGLLSFILLCSVFFIIIFFFFCAAKKL